MSNSSHPHQGKSQELTQEQVQKIAKLARLQVSAAEAQEYAQQLSKALGYFEQISSLDTQGVEPLVTPTDMEEILREDIAKKELSAEELLANAPQRTGNLFTVPPVV